jgi:hypothetical protein
VSRSGDFDVLSAVEVEVLARVAREGRHRKPPKHPTGLEWRAKLRQQDQQDATTSAAASAPRGPGLPLTDVKAYMGHAYIATTMIYVHHVPQVDAAEKLSAACAFCDALGGVMNGLLPILGLDPNLVRVTYI